MNARSSAPGCAATSLKETGMNLRAKLTTTLLLTLMAHAITSCGTTAEAAAPAVMSPTRVVATTETGAVFSDAVMHRDWILAEIRTAAQTVTLDQRRLAGTGFDSLFSIRFEESMVFGRAAPNLLRGPYALEEDGRISLGMMATTRMATLSLPELNENEFLGHLGNVAWWSLSGGNLQLHVDDAAMTDLIFAPAAN